MHYKDQYTIYGKTRVYLKGEVVVWRGYNPAILRMPEAFVLGSESQNSSINFNEKYNSCHYSNIRPANKKEIEILGNKEYIEYPV